MRDRRRVPLSPRHYLPDPADVSVMNARGKQRKLPRSSRRVCASQLVLLRDLPRAHAPLCPRTPDRHNALVDSLLTDRSAVTVNDLPPSSWISLLRASSALLLRPTATTLAFAAANFSAQARPIPEVAPVISTTFPSNSWLSMLFVPSRQML